MDRKYEVLFLINPSLDKAEITKITADLESKLSGKIVKKEEWGLKKLAYKINNFVEGVYVLYYVETTPDAILDVKEYLSINKKNIIRSLILKHDKAFPFEMKTSKEIKFPERKPRSYGPKKPYNRNFDRNKPRTFDKTLDKKTISNKERE